MGCSGGEKGIFDGGAAQDFIYNSILIKLMEVNVPDKGVFKGMGKLETNQFINKKHFPRIRNIHQF